MTYSATATGQHRRQHHALVLAVLRTTFGQHDDRELLGDDDHGNTASGSFTVTVTLTDKTKPVVTAPTTTSRGEAASGAEP